MMNEKSREVLLKAADLLDERDWARAEFEDKDGRLCTYGALNMVIFGRSTIPFDFDDNDLVILEEIENEFQLAFRMTILGWNGMVCENKAQAMKKLRELANYETG